MKTKEETIKEFGRKVAEMLAEDAKVDVKAVTPEQISQQVDKGWVVAGGKVKCLSCGINISGDLEKVKKDPCCPFCQKNFTF